MHIYSLGFIWFYCFIPCNHLVNASQISTWLHLGDVASLCIGRSSALTFMVSHHGISISWAHSVKSQGLKISSILWFLVHVFSWMSEIFSDCSNSGPSGTCIIFTCILCGELCGTESAATPWAGLYFDWRSRLLRGPFVSWHELNMKTSSFLACFKGEALFVDLGCRRLWLEMPEVDQIPKSLALTSSRSRTGLLVMLSRTLPTEAFRRHH